MYLLLFFHFSKLKFINDDYRDVSRGVLLPVNRFGIPNSYPKLIKKSKNLKVTLNKLSPSTMSNTIDKYIIIENNN